MLFKSARFKLTFWYLLIIMTVSISFSFFVYRQVISEVKRSLRIHSLKQQLSLSPVYQITPQFGIPTEEAIALVENQIYEEIRNRILLQLIIVNLGVGAFSAIAGYFLAGKTLHPIETMLEDQKRFTADASHELRTPLTAMKTEIEVSLRDTKLSKEDAILLLKSNLEEVNKMQKLANYLLSLNRYQDQQTTLSMETIDIRDVVSDAVDHVKHLSDEKDIVIINKSSSIQLVGNSMSLTELFTILLDNAIKYSDREQDIHIKTLVDKKTLNIEIKDFGVGIKSSEIPYIFNRFYRADSSRSKTEIDGYGLGLSIAKSIVEAHNGKITVESIPNKGTRFTVSFPLS